MTIAEIIEMLQDMDPDEPAAFHMVTHSEMHVAAHAAGIETDCEQVDRALTIYAAMHRFKIGMDPFLIFKALGRAADDEDEDSAKPEVHRPIFH